MRCFIREAAVQRANSARRRRTASGRVRLPKVYRLCVRRRAMKRTLFAALDRRALLRDEAISKTPGRDRGHRASGPASVSSVIGYGLAVEKRTVCHTSRFFTSLTVLSIPAPQRVPRRRVNLRVRVRAAPASPDRARVLTNEDRRWAVVRVRREPRGSVGRVTPGRETDSVGRAPRTTVATWLILPVVICLSQRLSHACLSTNLYTVKLRMAH